TGGGHYTVTLVSTSFAGLTRVEQHRRVYESLGRRMGTMIHALALRTMTPDEWSRLTD
ncbi:MAG: BolA family transcriptional regulator, partial [Acidobacteriota bacterium]|nr:BolA family transcriptional regulator [Acidobacteriota bacterium]